MKHNLVGQRFGRLLVVEQAGVNKWGNYLWLCQCDCGGTIVRPGGVLTRGDTRSCGCLGRENLEKLRQAKLKNNRFRTEGELVYVEMSNTGREMVCDKDDWKNLKDYCWFEETTGYARSRDSYFHKLVCHAENPMVVDHINRNKLDNRRCNLRAVNRQMNALNNDSSGVTWHKAGRKWAASIYVDGKHLHLGLFENKRDALRARQEFRRKLGIED